MVCANCGADSHRTGNSACQNYCTLCAIGSCPYRVCRTCDATGHSVRECPSKTGSDATRAETKRICNPAALATKRANVARNMAIASHNVPNHDAKHPAAQIIKMLAASHALSTGARNAKA